MKIILIASKFSVKKKHLNLRIRIFKCQNFEIKKTVLKKILFKAKGKMKRWVIIDTIK